jgi:hypothetical protein
MITGLLEFLAEAVPAVAVMPAVVETAGKPSALAQAGQPRAKTDHKPLPDIERLESTFSTRSIACRTGSVTLISPACVRVAVP